MASQMQALPDVLAALCGLAQLEARQAADEASLQAALAALLFVDHDPAATQKMKDEARRLASELEARLTPAAIEAARATAHGLSLETLVTRVLAPASNA